MIAVSGLRANDASQPQAFLQHRAFHHISGLLLSIVFAVVSDNGRVEQVHRVVCRVVKMKELLLPAWRRALARKIELQKLRRFAEPCAWRNRGPQPGVMRPEL